MSSKKKTLFDSKSATLALPAFNKSMIGAFAAILALMIVFTANRAEAAERIFNPENAQVWNFDRQIAPVSQTEFADLLPDGSSVAYVEPERYLGRWYEIATYEQIFQRGCTGTTATYTEGRAGRINVLNECYVGDLDGRFKSASAYARIVDTETNSKLKVYFFPLFGADYWIIELDGQPGQQPYEWAVVGSSSSNFLWILSRTPQMDPERLELILQALAERGYDLEELSFTEQPVP